VTASRIVCCLLIASLITPIAARGGGFDRAIDAAMPRVVKLYGLGVGAQAGYGTGVVVSSDGLVLTVFSLLIDARQVRAVTSNGTHYEAEVVHRDNARQLALLRLKPPDQSGDPANELRSTGPFTFFDLKCGAAEEAALRPGDWVLAAGNPFKVADGAEPVSVVHGVFSARTRLDARRSVKEFPYQGDVLVIDAITSNPGAPGSAVVDVEGRFVGMIGREVVSNLTHTHFNYAMPRDVLCEFFKEATGVTPRDALAEANASKGGVDPGIRLTRTGYRDIPPMVDRVRRGSAAELAGVRQDDLILSLNGKNVANPEEYDERLRSIATGEGIDLVIRRGRNVVTIRLEPEKR
jgi:serine protease Do